MSDGSVMPFWHIARFLALPIDLVRLAWPQLLVQCHATQGINSAAHLERSATDIVVGNVIGGSRTGDMVNVTISGGQSA